MIVTHILKLKWLRIKEKVILKHDGKAGEQIHDFVVDYFTVQ